MATDTTTLHGVTRPRVALAVLLAGQIMASIDGSIVAVAAPSIRTGLGAGGAEIQLVVSGYLLTTGVLFITGARLGDVIGHRRAFVGGLAWFTAASLACGLAADPPMLIAARVAQAVGAALLMPQVFSLIHREWEGRGRRRAIGLYSMVLALGVALGQVLGGLVVGSDVLGLGWRAVFLVNVPVGLLVIGLAVRHLPRSGGDDGVRLDPLGVTLLTGAMTALTLPLVFGPERGWPAWTWAVLGGGAVLLLGFVRYESVARDPVLDLEPLRSRPVRLGLVACCLVMGCYTVYLLVLTVHLQSELGLTPLQAGLAFVPYAIGFGALSLTWSACPARVRGVLPVVGPLTCAAGMLLVVLLHAEEWTSAGTAPLLLLAGAGHAAGYSPLIARITTQVSPRLASSVSALNATGPVLAEVLGVAGLDSLYFTAPTSSEGLLRVAAAAAGLLGVATACAYGTLRRR